MFEINIHIYLNFTFGPKMPESMTSVNLSIGLVGLDEENSFVTYYNISYKSLDWDDAWHNFSVYIDHSHEEHEYWKMLENVLVDCSHVKYPQPTSTLVHHIVPLYYYTNYRFIGKACSDEGCSFNERVLEFQTAEHFPTCPPLFSGPI